MVTIFLVSKQRVGFLRAADGDSYPKVNSLKAQNPITVVVVFLARAQTTETITL